MKFHFTHLLAAGAVAVGSLTATTAIAQDPDWPQRPITIVVPFSAGAATDLITRQLGRALSKELGQPFVVENRPGAAAAIGASAVARAQPDGYTFLMGGPAANVTNRFLNKNLNYDPAKFE